MITLSNTSPSYLMSFLTISLPRVSFLICIASASFSLTQTFSISLKYISLKPSLFVFLKIFAFFLIQFLSFSKLIHSLFLKLSVFFLSNFIFFLNLLYSFFLNFSLPKTSKLFLSNFLSIFSFSNCHHYISLITLSMLHSLSQFFFLNLSISLSLLLIVNVSISIPPLTFFSHADAACHEQY